MEHIGLHHQPIDNINSTRKIKGYAKLYKHVDAKYLSNKINNGEWGINNTSMWNNVSNDTIKTDDEKGWKTYFIGVNDFFGGENEISNRRFTDMDVGLKINKTLYLEKYSLSSNTINKDWDWTNGYKNDKIFSFESAGLKLDHNGNALIGGDVKNTKAMYGKFNTEHIEDFDAFPK